MYSQSDEDEVLSDLFNKIGTETKCLVDIGAGDGILYSNTRRFIENGWYGFLFDKMYDINNVHKEHITLSNLNFILTKYNVPTDIDLLSIDIDGMDYYIWKYILIKPRVVIIEYNQHIDSDKSIVIKYQEFFNFDNTDYYGASYLAMKKLGEELGYKIYDISPTNIIFIKNNINIESLNTQFSKREGFTHDTLNREWVLV